jgi:hypothetical protein
VAAQNIVTKSRNYITTTQPATANLHPIMQQAAKAAFEKFIAVNHIKKVDGIMLFNASIGFYANQALQQIISPVQLVLLPDAMALYLYEFFNEVYQLPEMYSSETAHFLCTGNGTMEIRLQATNGPFLLSVTPL